MSLTAITGASVYYLETGEVHGDIVTPVIGDLAIYTYAAAGEFIGKEYSYSGSAWFAREQITETASGEAAGLAVISKGDVVSLGTDIDATGAQTAVSSGGVFGTYQATLDAVSTTPAATIDIEVSNDNVAWIVMGTISLSGSSDTDGFSSNTAWKYTRANVTAISDGGGTAKVTVTMGG